jgi:hypothetical protein
MATIQNSQDAYASLLEDCRCGFVRTYHTNAGGKIRVVPSKINFPVDVPVFAIGVLNPDPDATLDMLMAAEAATGGEVHLPYPRSALMYENSRAAKFLVLVQQIDANVIDARTYDRAPKEQHWRLLPWTGNFFVHEIEHFVLEFDPSYEDHALESTTDRLTSQAVPMMQTVKYDLLRIMHETGRASQIGGGSVSTRINARRQKLGLPAVTPIRRLEFGQPTLQVVQHRSTGTGSAKTTHQRRATIRKLGSGRKVFVKACVINPNGPPAPPPWYSVVT